MPTHDLASRVCLLTGATNGIGRAAADALGRTGMTLLLVGRDPARTEAAVKAVREASANPRVHGYSADLSLRSDVRRLAAEVRAAHSRLHILVNNAGAVFTRREVTAEGTEKTLALNHVAYFLLTGELRPLLVASAPARVVVVASEAHRGASLDFDDLESRRRYTGLGVYGKTKLMNVLFTAELARRLAGTGVTANALHPGVVATGFGQNTPGLFKSLVGIARPFMLSPEKGAETMVYLATSPEVEGVTGKYFEKCREARPSAAARDPESARRLWELSERLVSGAGTAAA